jgi:hypothetical protein
VSSWAQSRFVDADPAASDPFRRHHRLLPFVLAPLPPPNPAEIREQVAVLLSQLQRARTKDGLGRRRVKSSVRGMR